MSNIRRGFTLIELLVVIAVIAILIGILIPSLSFAKEMANRSGCAANLAGIGKAITLYAAMENDAYHAEPPPGYGMNISDGWYNPPSASGKNGGIDAVISSDYTLTGGAYPSDGDPMAGLYLLILKGLTTTKQFLCPSDPHQPTAADFGYGPPNQSSTGFWDNFGVVNGNFPTANTFSYSFAYPWFADTMKPGPWWQNTMDGSLPIGSDMAPSGQTATDDPTINPGQKISNSKNHSAGAGQNVLYADGHVAFSNTNRVGQNNDNIFCYSGNSIWVTAADPNAGTQGFSSTPNFDGSGSAPFDIIMVPAYP